jgi:hypothetical protein
MVDRTREKTITVRVTEAEVEMLKALAEHAGLSQSDVVRQSIRRDFAQLKPSKPKKR